MSKIKTAIQAVKEGSFIRLVIYKLFPIENQDEVIKNKRIKYWTDLTIERLASLPQVELNEDECSKVRQYWGGGIFYFINFIKPLRENLM